jgi:chromosome segregation ATPase
MEDKIKEFEERIEVFRAVLQKLPEEEQLNVLPDLMDMELELANLKNLASKSIVQEAKEPKKSLKERMAENDAAIQRGEREEPEWVQERKKLRKRGKDVAENTRKGVTLFRAGISFIFWFIMVFMGLFALLWIMGLQSKI